MQVSIQRCRSLSLLTRSSKARLHREQLDVLIAGDDEEAKRKVSQLGSDGGLRSLDVGPLSIRIRHLARSGCEKPRCGPILQAGGPTSNLVYARTGGQFVRGLVESHDAGGAAGVQCFVPMRSRERSQSRLALSGSSA
jgi:hypothetical protein